MELLQSYNLQGKVSKNMAIQTNSITFNISVNSLYDEAMEKLRDLNNIEIQFLRKFQNQLSNSACHASMLFSIRSTLSKLQQVFEDLHSYFSDLNLSFAFDLFRKMHVLVITGYNYTAEAFSVALSELKNDTNLIEDSPELRKAKDKKQKTINQFKKIEEMDFVINSLEAEQEKVNDDILEMYREALAHRKIVQKMKPSDTFRQIQEIKQNVQTIISHAESTFEQAYMHKYQTFKKHVTELGKPQDIGQTFYCNMEQAMKQKFINGMTKVACRIKEMNKPQPVKILTTEQCTQTQKPQVITAIKSKFPVHQNKKIPQKHSSEIESLRKSPISTVKQNADLIGKYKNIQKSLQECQENYETLKNLYHSKSSELQNLRKETTGLVEQKQRQIQRLKISDYRSKKIMIDVGVHVISQQYPVNRIQKQIQAKHLTTEYESEVAKILKTNNQRFIIRLSQRDTRIRQLQRQVRESSTLKLEFSNVLNTVCNELRMDHIREENEQLPTLPSLIRRTSILLDTLKADHISKNLLQNADLNRCSIQNDSKQTPTNKQKGAIEDLTVSYRRKNRRTKIQESVIEAFNSLRRKKNTDLPQKDTERLPQVLKNNINYQAQPSNDKDTKVSQDWKERKCQQTQTDYIKDSKYCQLEKQRVEKMILSQISCGKKEHSESKKVNFSTQRLNNKPSPSRENQTSTHRNMHSFSNKNQSQKISDKAQKQTTQGAKTAGPKWRERYHQLRDTQNKNRTQQLSVKRKLSRQDFQTIKIDDQKQPMPLYWIPYLEIKNTQQQKSITQLNKTDNKSRQQSKLKGGKNSQKQSTVLRERSLNSQSIIAKSECMSSLFQVKRIDSSENPRQKLCPKKLLESVKRLQKGHKKGYKEVVFSISESNSQHIVNQLISSILMGNQAISNPDKVQQTKLAQNQYL